MKVRACILVVCMTVVPAWAMFSHHVPPGVREAVRTLLWQPLARCFHPADAASQPVADPVAGPVAEARSPATTPALVPATQSPAERLAALGAVAVDIRPLEGVAGVHVASCRVAMDAEGQLHRVFQAPGVDPGAATAALADQVQAWRERLDVRAAAPAPVRPL